MKIATKVALKTLLKLEQMDILALLVKHITDYKENVKGAVVMIESKQFPKQRKAPFEKWSPSVHYAQFQSLGPCKFEERRLYDFELLFVRQGELITHMYGQKHTISAGQLIFLPSGVYHRNEVILEGETKLIGIHFDFFNELDIQTESDMVVNEEQILPHKFALEAISNVFAPLSSNVTYTPPLACIQLMEALVEEFTMRPLGYELVSKGLMLHIITLLLRNSLSSTNTRFSQHGVLISRLIKQIEARPAELWTNAIIAEQMNLSIDYTAKLFKQLTGMPPSGFVKMVRHREARKLLRETNLSIERIGEQIGYPDIHYFSRTFRKQEGISATDYRKLSQVL